MTINARIGSMVALLAVPATSLGFGICGPVRGKMIYYYPAPVLYAPVLQPVVIDPCAWPLARPQVGLPAVSTVPPVYATPTAAPPSSSSLKTTAEPPVAPAKEPERKPAPPMAPAPPALNPTTDAPRSFYDAYPAAGDVGQPVTSATKVRFWNLSDRTITLNVDQRDYTLAKGQSVKLTLNREFVWKAGRFKPQREQVPAQASGLEIVIRQ